MKNGKVEEWSGNRERKRLIKLRKKKGNEREKKPKKKTKMEV